LNKRITILGGGLAGLTLGIGLRRRGVPVTVLEAGRYPRHRACGELISGLRQDALARVGLLEALSQAGAQRALTATFFLPNRCDLPIRRLEQSALCISRFKLDALLADYFRNTGGDLCQNTRADLHDVPEGAIRTTGRRAHPVENGAMWFGIKIHARKLPLVADLEMHVLKDGYVGLCGLPDNEVNVCGLFRRSSRRRKEAASSCLPFPIPGSSTLHQRLSGADLDQSSFCSVAGLSLKPQRALSLPELSLGDALTMIPPVTGNGMSMAFEAAELAIEPLAAYSRGDLAWTSARGQIARACDSRFASRLRWAQWLQWMMFSPIFQNYLGALALSSQFAWNTLFRRTRS